MLKDEPTLPLQAINGEAVAPFCPSLAGRSTRLESQPCKEISTEKA